MSSDDVTSKLSDEIAADSPKIEQALKNLVSIILAKVMSSNGVINQPQNEVNSIEVTPDIALSCVRIILKSINEQSLLSPLEWGLINVQGENQTALSRIDEISKYRVLYSMHLLCLSKSGKVTKLFGKLFFLWSNIWPNISAKILQEDEIDDGRGNSNRVAALRYIVEAFGKSLSIDPTDDDDLALVWSKDFAGALRIRQSKRQEQIKLRQQQLQIEQQEELQQQKDEQQKQQEESRLEQVQDNPSDKHALADAPTHPSSEQIKDWQPSNYLRSSSRASSRDSGSVSLVTGKTTI